MVKSSFQFSSLLHTCSNDGRLDIFEGAVRIVSVILVTVDPTIVFHKGFNCILQQLVLLVKVLVGYTFVRVFVLEPSHREALFSLFRFELEKLVRATVEQSGLCKTTRTM